MTAVHLGAAEVLGTADPLGDDRTDGMAWGIRRPPPDPPSVAGDRRPSSEARGARTDAPRPGLVPSDRSDHPLGASAVVNERAPALPR